MHYRDLGEDFAPLRHAILWRGGTELEDAIEQGIIGHTESTSVVPGTSYYARGDLWVWICRSIGDKSLWKLVGNRMGVEIRFATKQQAMECKLRFGGDTPLRP